MKVFDSFIFFNELDLLEMRLNILNDVVDHFVLTESPFTVSGNEKPLYYQENKDRFGKFNDKIVHHITEEIPNDFTHLLEKTKFHVAYKNNDPYGTPMIDLPVRFQRALFNRNNSAFGIEKAGATDEDLVITSDADEIINPLLDDLNTPLAISNLLKIKCSKTLFNSANLLGLLNKTSEEWFSLNNKSTITKNDIELLIKERDDARKSKDYVKADEIRSQLDQNNVILEDIDGKTIWRVKK